MARQYHCAIAKPYRQGLVVLPARYHQYRPSLLLDPLHL
jgi:hypothetical protein